MTDFTTLSLTLNLVFGTLGGLAGFFWWATHNSKKPLAAALYGAVKTIILIAMMGAVVVFLAYDFLPDPQALSAKLAHLQLILIYLTPAPFLGSLLAYAAACYSLKLEKKRGSG